MSSNDNEDWFVACSDEEKYTSTSCKKGKLQWTPKPEVMIQLFEQIDKGEKEGNCMYLTESNLNLDWKCPGRRPPTPSDESDMDDYEGKNLGELQEPKSSVVYQRIFFSSFDISMLSIKFICFSDDEDFESQESSSSTGVSSASLLAGGSAKNNASSSKNDFDFDADDDGMLSTPRGKLQLASSSKELRGSARKKTTDLSSILSNMKKHKELSKIEQNKEAAAAASLNSEAAEGTVAGAINSIMTDSNDSIS